MPKIEVKESALLASAGMKQSPADWEPLLVVAKGEVDDHFPGEDRLKLEFNDTNRPDLWSTAGAGRLLRVYHQGASLPEYPFLSRKGDLKDTADRKIVVDAKLKDIRPYIAAFAVRGRVVDQVLLDDMIQTQEKLCWNYGRRRRSIAMGIYRSREIQYPVAYKGEDPGKSSFQALGLEEELNLASILEKHPKGQEFGYIIKDFPLYPMLREARGGVLSMPPVINSAGIGAVEAGDEELFVELTGTDWPSLLLACNIVACDFYDMGLEILPVKIEYPYDTPLGRSVVTPYYFQEPASAEIGEIQKLLGSPLSQEEISRALLRMGCPSSWKGNRVTIEVPAYRNDFLHGVDVVEDVIIGHGLDNFPPESSRDFTVGRLTPEELFTRKARDLMVGLGFQEMIYNYLGSRKDYFDKMNMTAEQGVQILNPMTENYEYVRSSILPCLLASEAVSAHAVYPHHIFEIGKVAYRDDADNQGSVTRNHLGFMSAGPEANFNTANSQIAALLYYLNTEYRLEEREDPRFIPGRCAEVLVKDRSIGLFGEAHPLVLENWGIGMPLTLAELDLDRVLELLG